jgi:hypothetical protein
MSLIFDIKLYDAKKEAFQDFGFSVIKALETLDIDGDGDSIEYFVLSGVQSINIYEGAPP